MPFGAFLTGSKLKKKKKKKKKKWNQWQQKNSRDQLKQKVTWTYEINKTIKL